MRINKSYSPELQKDLRDIKQKLESFNKGQAPIQRGVIGGGGGENKPIQVKSTGPQPGTINGDLYINGTLLVNGSTPLYSESNLLTPSVTDATSSRLLNTVYQNTNTTMIDVRVSVKHA